MVSVSRPAMRPLMMMRMVVASADRFDYQKANDLEKILLDIDVAITNLKKAWYFTGDIFAGEA